MAEPTARDRMHPASGKMYKSDGSVLDEAAVLDELYDQLTGDGVNINAELELTAEAIKVVSPDGGTTKLFAKSENDGTMHVHITGDDLGLAEEATLDGIKTAIDNINTTVSGGRLLVTLPAAVTSDITDTKTAVEALADLISAGALVVDDPDTQTKLDSAIGELQSIYASTENVLDATETISALVDSGELKIKDLTSHGKLDSIITQLTSANTSLDNIEEDADDTRIAMESVDTKVGEVQESPTANTVLARLKDLLTGIVLAAGTNVIGKIGNTSLIGAGEPSVDSYSSDDISLSADTTNQQIIGAPGANKQIWVYGYQFTCGTGDGTVSIQDEDDTAHTGVMEFSQRGGISVSPSGNFAMPVFKVATNKALEMDTVTCDVEGAIQYAIVDVS